MSTMLMAAGFVLVFEGLVFALLPARLEDLAAALEQLSHETRRYLGLGAVAIGVILLWAAKGLAGF